MITITTYKMVEQDSLVFNFQVPVPPSGQQAAGGEEAPSAPQHPANPGTQPSPAPRHKCYQSNLKITLRINIPTLCRSLRVLDTGTRDFIGHRFRVAKVIPM